MRSWSKKGDGLSMNVIIIAILALLVLVVLSLIFIKQMNKTDETTNSICIVEKVGAKCIKSGETYDTANLVVADTTGKKKFSDCLPPNTCVVPK
ncbi:MAG: hypothetical protein WC755_03425 [Candidatus Woesearchaeota archaeon]|jgi:uncharacterized protein YxeA